MDYEQKHPILQKLEEYFKNTPKEQIDKDWSDILKDTDSEAYYEKKYKDSIEKMKSWVKGEHPDCFCEAQKTAEFIFPELAESEDERIIKAIHNALKYLETELYWDFIDEVDILDVYAWLEKQGKKLDAELGQSEVTKTSDQELESKFHPGDWIVDDETPNDGFRVIEALEEIYKVIDVDGDDYHIPHCKADKQFHLWTIQDAKDGDLIYVSTGVKGIQAIFHKFENGIIYFHCNLCSDFTQGGYELYDDVKFVNPLPKTHYQRFFQKMNEAGYEWDAEKNDLKKIEQNPVDKVDPKFKVGDWVVSNNNGKVWQIGAQYTNEGQRLYLYNVNDVIMSVTLEELNNDFHLWTIQDAKDGDVLHSTGFYNDCIFIFNGLVNWIFDKPNGDKAVATGYCCLSVSADKMEFGTQGPDCIEVNTIKPATKIQRDLLFQKMKEAGYEWDAEKNDLKKIEVASKESEDRIRKALKQGFSEYGNSFTTFGGIKVEEILAWFEKQGKSDEEENAALPDVPVNERIRDSIALVLTDVDEQVLINRGVTLKAALDWIERQCETKTECPQDYRDVDRPNGCIVFADFNGGEGYYKLHLDYLNRKQVEEIEELIRIWNEKKNNRFQEDEQSIIDKVHAWLKELSDNHYIMDYTDSHEVTEEELIDYFHKAMKNLT